MNRLFAAALEVQQFLEHRRWQFALIGGLAVLRWGEALATQDVDISLLTGFGREEQYVDEVLRQFSGRIPAARGFALQHRVVLIAASNGVPVDIALAGIPFEERLIARASYFAFLPEVSLRTCSAEDLLVLKAFAGRDKDWAALGGVIARQRGSLDWAYVERQLAPLCEAKGEPELLQRLAALRQQIERG